MKKVFAVIIAAVMVCALSVFASADYVSCVSCDRVYITDAEGGKVDLANFGVNSQTDTQLGDITDKVDESFQIFGWTSSFSKIVEFGYRYGDEVVLGSKKADTGTDVINAGKTLVGEDADTSRFNITVPVKAGTDVEVFAVVKYDDDTIADLWRVVYTSSKGAADNTPSGSDETPGEQGGEEQQGGEQAGEPDTNGNQTNNNPTTADASVIAIAAVACAALAGVVIAKKVK